MSFADICDSIVTDKALLITIIDCVNEFNMLKMQILVLLTKGCRSAGSNCWSSCKIRKQSKIDGVMASKWRQLHGYCKLVALLANSERALRHLRQSTIKAKRFPLILYSTTAGTRSEVPDLNCKPPVKQLKTGVVSAELLRHSNIVQPNNSLPPQLHGTGIDAIVHGFEAFNSAKSKKIH